MIGVCRMFDSAIKQESENISFSVLFFRENTLHYDEWVFLVYTTKALCPEFDLHRVFHSIRDLLSISLHQIKNFYPISPN